MKTSNKGRRFPPEPLTKPEIEALLSACSRGPSGLRNQALIILLWRAGLRVSEALALRPKDLDPSGTLRVLHGKGDRCRTVGVDPQAFAVIQRWLDRRAALGIDGRCPVVCTLAGRPLETAYVRALLPRLARRAGIAKRVHPHGLRHTCASELRAEGVDVGVISRQLGHSSIATTVRYLDHVAPQQVIDAMQSRAW